MAEFNWNSVVQAASGASTQWSDTVQSGREKKESTKKYAVTAGVIAVTIITVGIIMAIAIRNKNK